MQKPGRQKLWQAIGCLLSVALAWRNTVGFEGSEFSGGRVTGPLLTMTNVGSVLFVLTLVVTFVYPRIAAAIALAASLLCLPFYIYFTTPGPFRRVFRGEYTVPLQTSFVWNTWHVAGMLTLAVTAYICLRGFAATGWGKAPERG
jgi:hypothetical protein